MDMHQRFITVQNIKIRLNETGSGQPVLFIHGNPDSADMWTEVIEHLPQGYHYLAPDLPGFGQSGAATNFDWSIQNRGQWVADVLDAAGITEPVVLVVHDHGGPFGGSFAVQYPDMSSNSFCKIRSFMQIMTGICLANCGGSH